MSVGQNTKIHVQAYPKGFDGTLVTLMVELAGRSVSTFMPTL